MKSSLCALAFVLVACGGGSAESPPDHAAGHPGAASHPEHASSGGHAEHGRHHDFSEVERFAAIFDDPERDAWQKPDEILRLLELRDGLVVADLGAGTGYFEPHLSRAVQATGRVLALDVEPAMVAHMQTRFADAGLSNVEARVVAPDDPGLAPESVDRILIVDTWHHIDARGDYAGLLRRALRPGGYVLIVDFTSESPLGAPARMRLSPDAVHDELSAGGLSAHLVDEDLPYQYVVRGDRDATPAE